jgi:competence protein ComEA
LALQLITLGQEVNMTHLKKIVSLLVVICIFTLFAPQVCGAEKSADGKSDKSGLININTAGADALMKLPRIGPKMAQRIIDFRKENGKFKKIEDLMKVKGIGEKTFKGFQDKVKI